MTSFSPEPEFWVEDRSDGWNDEGWAGGDDGAPPEGPPPPPRPSRWPRWVALAAGLAVIAGLIAWQSQAKQGPPALDQADSRTSLMSSPMTTPSIEAPTATGPATAETDAPARPTAWRPQTSDVRVRHPELTGAKWQLIGYGGDGVTRYIPATGELITTLVPLTLGGGPLTVLATSEATIIRPFDSVTGFLVPDGKPAEPLKGLLAGGGGTLPGPAANRIWVVGQAGTATGDSPSGTSVVSGNNERPKLILVDEDGSEQGVTLDIPETAGMNPDYAVVPDGTGFALFYGVGGLYRLGPDGSRLVTHGKLIASGPATLLLNECDERARCSLVVVDRAKEQRRPLPGTVTALPSDAASGITSPDGRWAAVLDLAMGSVTLIDLQTGHVTVPFVDSGWRPNIRLASDALAFTPGSRHLLISSDSGVSLIETESGRSLGQLPLPPQRVIALRPGN